MHAHLEIPGHVDAAQFTCQPENVLIMLSKPTGMLTLISYHGQPLQSLIRIHAAHGTTSERPLAVDRCVLRMDHHCPVRRLETRPPVIHLLVPGKPGPTLVVHGRHKAYAQRSCRFKVSCALSLSSCMDAVALFLRWTHICLDGTRACMIYHSLNDVPDPHVLKNWRSGWRTAWGKATTRTSSS